MKKRSAYRKVSGALPEPPLIWTGMPTAKPANMIKSTTAAAAAKFCSPRSCTKDSKHQDHAQDRQQNEITRSQQ